MKCECGPLRLFEIPDWGVSVLKVPTPAMYREFAEFLSGLESWRPFTAGVYVGDRIVPALQIAAREIEARERVIGWIKLARQRADQAGFVEQMHTFDTILRWCEEEGWHDDEKVSRENLHHDR